MSQLVNLVEFRAVRAARRLLDARAFKSLIACGQTGEEVKAWGHEVGGKKDGLEVVWWAHEDMPRFERVIWADCIVVVQYQVAMDLWFSGLEGNYGRIGGGHIGHGMAINIFGRDLRHEGYRQITALRGR